MRQRWQGWLHQLAGLLRRLVAWARQAVVWIWRAPASLRERWRGRTRRPPRPPIEPAWVHKVNDVLTAGDDVRSAPWHLVVGVIAGLLLVSGVTYAVSSRDVRPARPFVLIAPVEQVGGAVFDNDVRLLYVEVEDTVRAYVAPDGETLTYCEESGRIESTDGGVHDLDGRALNGRVSLRQRRVQIHEDLLFVDLTNLVDAPTGTDEGAVVECSSR